MPPTPPLSALLSALALSPAQAGLPLYRQVEARLRQLAALPEFQQGALWPDEFTLANRLGVSRGTARAALARLVQEGILERKAGVGTRVARAKPQSAIRAWRSFSREMAAKGITVENFRTEFRPRPATATAARELLVAPETLVPRLDRIRGWGGQPVLFSSSWLHPRLRLPAAADFTRPLYDLIEAETGIVAANAREVFTAVAATAEMAKRLAVRPGTPLLLRCHTVSAANGRPIEYAEVHYVSARFPLTLELRQES